MTFPLALRTIRAIMRREFIDVLRDRRSLVLTFLWPMSMLVGHRNVSRRLRRSRSTSMNSRRMMARMVRSASGKVMMPRCWRR